MALEKNRPDEVLGDIKSGKSTYKPMGNFKLTVICQKDTINKRQLSGGDGLKH
jgi:hypothetical protein